ncbi:SIS domain-containing protein [Rhodobacteraceae bacterium CYK-10]|uniref:SIS domain-containing protein n=2 Tax=Stagnihabitans tardus TaxID=2699202 RepID=A0AAE5BW98_9RHOB|nr:SIS domain-containing protein [Stagnihabitans tardus]
MRAELAEAAGVFRATLEGAVSPEAAAEIARLSPRAIYTIARGSSDAAANILSYEFMRELGVPMTSLPPSVFSVGRGVAMDETLALVVSQSGASNDLVLSAEGARARGARVVGLINAASSPVSAHADLILPIGAGPELAVPATKSVVGAIAAGMALLGAMVPDYRARALEQDFLLTALPEAKAVLSALLRANHVYVIGRDTGYGAAQELALKLKETCAIHAEAYSSSEVLHGPLQLATNPLLVLILDTGAEDVQASLDTAEARFRAAGGTVHRLRTGIAGLTPAAAAACLLCLTYPLVLETALALGHDPDRPETLSKVTQTI